MTRHAEDGRQRAQQDREVHPYRPVVDVPQIELRALVEVAVEARADLPQSRYTRFDRKASAVPKVIPLDLARRCRAGPDDAHVTAQDVEELGQLVEAEASQPPTRRRDARIADHLEGGALRVAHRRELAIARLGVAGHRP